MFVIVNFIDNPGKVEFFKVFTYRMIIIISSKFDQKVLDC